MDCKVGVFIMVYCDGRNLVSSTSQEELRSFATRMGIHSNQFKRNRLPRYILTKDQAQHCFIMGARYIERRQLVWLLRKLRNQNLDPEGVEVYEKENLL